MKNLSPISASLWVFVILLSFKTHSFAGGGGGCTNTFYYSIMLNKTLVNEKFYYDANSSLSKIDLIIKKGDSITLYFYAKRDGKYCYSRNYEIEDYGRYYRSDSFPNMFTFKKSGTYNLTNKVPFDSPIDKLWHTFVINITVDSSSRTNENYPIKLHCDVPRTNNGTEENYTLISPNKNLQYILNKNDTIKLNFSDSVLVTANKYYIRATTNKDFKLFNTGSYFFETYKGLSNVTINIVNTSQPGFWEYFPPTATVTQDTLFKEIIKISLPTVQDEKYYLVETDTIDINIKISQNFDSASASSFVWKYAKEQSTAKTTLVESNKSTSIRIQQAGFYTVSFKSRSGYDYDYTFYVKSNNPLANESFANNNSAISVTIIPNPVSNEMEIHSIKGKYLICNMYGQEILSGNAESDIFKLNTAALPSGTYIFQIMDGNKNAVKKFMKN